VKKKQTNRKFVKLILIACMWCMLGTDLRRLENKEREKQKKLD
jgi:hypothetical protein